MNINNNHIESIGFFPGCSLEGTARDFKHSLETVLRSMNIPVTELKDWTCCGSTSAHAIDPHLNLALNLRNLALAEAQGFDQLLVPCAACYHRLASSQLEFSQDDQLLNRMNEETGLSYRGSVRVRNILDFFVNTVGLDKIRHFVQSPLKSLTAVCYYGCLNTRVPHLQSFDTVEYPIGMDRLVQVLGAAVPDWSYKTECCGANLFITNPEISLKLTGDILQNAIDCGANAIVVSCPMCHNNLSLKQAEIVKKRGLSGAIPVYFITELMAAAFSVKNDIGRHR